MAKGFAGGVHPDDMKAMSKDCAVQEFPLPDKAWILLSQHIGAPCKPCVQKGDRVRTGQVVGEAQGFVSAPVHASVTGKVLGIEPVVHPVTGKGSPAVVIERDGEDDWAEGANVERSADALSADEIKACVLKAGIVGLGGATFPTHVKLSPPADKPIDEVILNAAECEPYLTCDYRLMMEHPAEVIEGFRLIMRALGVKRGRVGIEENKPDAAARLAEAASPNGDITVEACRVRYPQGAEHQLIKALLGREVPWHGGLPMAVGCVVQNVATAYAVYEAVRFNRPLIRRVCTVTGDGVERPANYLVRVGTPARALLSASGLRDDASKLILGGPMMGIAQRTAEMPVMKGTGGLLVMRHAAVQKPGPCIRCGACIRACPYGLVPSIYSRAMDVGDLAACERSHVLECKQCGCCTYVCPAKRPILHQIKLALDELRRKKAEADAKAKQEAARKAS